MVQDLGGSVSNLKKQCPFGAICVFQAVVKTTRATFLLFFVTYGHSSSVSCALFVLFLFLHFFAWSTHSVR